MKKAIIIIMAALMAMPVIAKADSKPAKKSKAEVKEVTFVVDFDCENCAKKIYDNFYGKGVKSIKCDVATKTVTVTFDSSKTNVEALVKAFTKIKIKAEPKK